MKRPSASAKRSTASNAAKAPIRCTSTLLRPAPTTGSAAPTWSFLRLPAQASDRLSSRGMVSVEGRFAGVAFAATLEPDGEGGHWLKVEKALRESAEVKEGDSVTLEFAPTDVEPEPTVPPALRAALASAPERTRETWADITPAARRDFIHWIESAKQQATRDKRVVTACDMLAKGKRRPCCFDRSGMYGKNLSCPVAADPPAQRRR